MICRTTFANAIEPQLATHRAVPAANGFPECAESKQCHSVKHHYDECVERVTKQIDDNGKADEDCVEECKHAYMQTHGKPATLHLLETGPR